MWRMHVAGLHISYLFTAGSIAECKKGCETPIDD